MRFFLTFVKQVSAGWESGESTGIDWTLHMTSSFDFMTSGIEPLALLNSDALVVSELDNTAL